MVWSQYREDSIQDPNDVGSDPEDNQEELNIPRNRPLPYDDWITWYSNDLLNLWMSIRAYKEDTGNQSFLLDQMDWNDFCEFCYKFSSKLPSSCPS